MKTRVKNMTNGTGRVIANQFVIETEKGTFFQSYNSVIAFKPAVGGKIQLDATTWDYSVTTGRYRNLFLNEKKDDTKKKIKNGTYELTDLN